MTGMDNITRKAQTGEPTTNGGHFASKQREDAAVGLKTPLPQREVNNFDLAPGDVIIGDNGRGRLTVKDVEPSDSQPGFMSVETNFGFLYLDADETSTVAAEDERYLEVSLQKIEPQDFEQVWLAAKDRLGIAGTYFSREDAESILDDQEDAEADGVEPASIDREVFWERVQDLYAWRNLDERMNERAFDSLSDAIVDLAAKIRAETK